MSDTKDLSKIATLMGGANLPLFASKNVGLHQHILIFFIPAVATDFASSVSLEEAKTKCPKHNERFGSSRITDISGVAYHDNNDYNSSAVVNMELLLREIGHFGHILPPRNVMLNKGYYSGSQPFCREARHSDYIDTYFDIHVHNAELLLPNMPSTLMKIERKIKFYVKVFIPFSSRITGCGFGKFACSSCSLAGLCDIGQIPAGILSSFTVIVDNPLYRGTRKDASDDVVPTIKKTSIASATAGTASSITSPLSGWVPATRVKSSIWSEDYVYNHTTSASKRELQWFRTVTRPYDDPEYVRMIFSNPIQLTYRHHFRYKTTPEGDVETPLDELVLSENEYDCRLVLADRFMFSKLPLLKKVMNCP